MSNVNNNAFEIVITPNSNRKRKREIVPKIKSSSGVLNGAFCSSTSTPKKDTKNLMENLTRFVHLKKPIYGKENNFTGMEIKSISELAAESEKQHENPYEVIRKPPKKKKKEITNGEESCFVNSALNLEVPDKKFNPFEVKRVSPSKDPKESNHNCFINPGLNIRVEDNVLNPYEITRNKTMECQQNGIENAALEMPRMLTLGIPFTPTVGCRINFNEIPLDNLTPTKMLSEKLNIAPINPRLTAIKSQTKEMFQRSLSIINEESVLDIGKELDCYQLELENSINEAKLKKKITENENLKIDLEESSTEISKNLKEISGIAELDESVETSKNHISIKIEESKEEKQIEETELKCYENNNKSFEDSFDDIDFKAPAPFVRAYRKPTVQIIAPSKPLSQDVDKKSKSKTNHVTNVIRRSIRKLMHPGKSDNKLNVNEDCKSQTDSSSGTNHHIFETIRHSLRRKPNKEIITNEIVENEKTEINSHELTLTERQIFRSTTEEFSVERKISLRSSLRKSTKEMRNHVMKSVFNKNIEEYKFAK